MACTFTIDIRIPAPDVVSSVKNKVEAQGGSFNGDSAAGNFEVPLLGSRVIGSYSVTGQQMTVNISDKPFFISCNQIRSFIEGQL